MTARDADSSMNVDPRIAQEALAAVGMRLELVGSVMVERGWCWHTNVPLWQLLPAHINGIVDKEGRT